MCKCDEKIPKVNVYGVSSKSLASFVTSERDLVRGISRNPGAYFLLNNTKDLDGEDQDDFDLDDTDDFIIIEREDLRERSKKLIDSLNNPNKIEKEEQTMRETVSSLMVDNTLQEEDKDHEMCLDDFRIKKVIDKGSFGKVFLVVNVIDGKEYAMKRINKDILIEKA